MDYLLRARAAEYITGRGIDMTAQALADAASDGQGPDYSIVRGRAVYTKTAIDKWLADQTASSAKRRAKRQDAA